MMFSTIVIPAESHRVISEALPSGLSQVDVKMTDKDRTKEMADLGEIILWPRKVRMSERTTLLLGLGRDASLSN